MAKGLGRGLDAFFGEDNNETIEELKELIDLKEIKKITLGDIELDIEKTLELMEETPIEYIFEDLEIWCGDFKIIIICEEYDFYEEI